MNLATRCSHVFLNFTLWPEIPAKQRTPERSEADRSEAERGKAKRSEAKQGKAEGTAKRNGRKRSGTKQSARRRTDAKRHKAKHREAERNSEAERRGNRGVSRKLSAVAHSVSNKVRSKQLAKINPVFNDQLDGILPHEAAPMAGAVTTHVQSNMDALGSTS